MEKINLGIVFGGKSSEYEVSLLSAVSVLNNINASRYNIIKIGITKQGRMYYYTGDTASIADGSWCETQKEIIPCQISISGDPKEKGLVLLQDSISYIQIDVVFPVLHGRNGEDGTLQGLLTIAGIPFVGCDTVSSGVCMDKELTHLILKDIVPMAEYVAVKQSNFANQREAIVLECEQKLLYPMFVKPANAGSSVGITKAHDRQELYNAIEVAFTHDKKVIIEQMLVGREVECAVLGNDSPVVATPGDIEPCNEWYDYDAKYLANKTNTNIPAKITDEQTKQVQELAVRAFTRLGCSGFARVDFFVGEESIYLNEINTIPGFTSISMYPKLWSYSGLSYPDLIDRLIELALEG